MIEIDKLSPRSGRIIGEDGKVYNEVDILKAKGSEAQPVNEKVYDISQFSPRSGRIVGEDGRVYNEVDLLDGIGGTDPEATHWLGVTTTPLVDNAVTNPITIAGKSVTAVSGNMTSVAGTNKEFIFDGTVWQEFGADSYSKTESDAKFAEKATLNSALVDNAAVNRFLVNIDEMVEANTDGTWDTSTDGEYIYTVGNADFSVHFNAGGWVTNISESQTEFNTDFKIYLWKNKIIPTSEFDSLDYTLYANASLTGSNVAFHLEQRNRYDTASLWEEVFLPSDTDYREVEIEQVGSKSYFNAYLQIGEESGTASFSDLWVKLIPNVNLASGLGNDDYFRTQRQLDAAVRELQKSGGGEGSVYMETVLYDGSDGGTTATVGELTLPQSATNFDCFVCLFGKADGTSHINKAIRIEPNLVVDNGWQADYGPVGWYISNGGLTFGWNNGNQMYPRKIIGINYGGGSGTS